MTHRFSRLSDVPDHAWIEHEILDWWEREGVFHRLRERNSQGPRWSFVDGPITANNPAGVHHCWGRALKDVFQRYKALQGFHQRYQNGFDCQGLWVEVEVEKSLGLNSKRDIEEYGLAEFADRCRERVAEYAGVITEQSKRLGMWMDWENSYFTFSDTNIQYIWRFLKTVQQRGWLFQGHRATEWCPRCGTSLSQHEQIDSYKVLTHPSLYVRLPLTDRPGEALLVWTTTPWTLPANVAVAVKDDADYVLLGTGDYVAAETVSTLPFDARPVRSLRGDELVGLRYEGPFDHLPAQEGVAHRVIPWEAVSLAEGTGIVHIAPGCGAEDFQLSKAFDLGVLSPVNEGGRFLPGYGPFQGLTTEDAATPIIKDLQARHLIVAAGEIEHRYPVCWRCSTPLIFRIVDDWFIAANQIRQPMLDANATVDWTPEYYARRMDDWLRNMGDWNISRKRFFGLPLPFYPCDHCGKVNVIGSLAELRARATTGLEQLRELHRPWIDEVKISCEHCDAEGLSRVAEVGDAWLDAGIVPFSTLGWENPTWSEGGYATGASEGLSKADLPDHHHWQQWFPVEWICEMREQIRLWFYSMSFMSVTLTGGSPYKRVLTYEKVRDEAGREMHKSWGNAIEADVALERMGADVMRWMFAEQTPGQDMYFGFGRAEGVKRRLLTFWNSVGFLITYANIVDFRPRYDDSADGPASPEATHPLDRWLLARVQEMLERVQESFERFWTPGVVSSFESFVDDLSNWYIRRSRRRFYGDDDSAFQTLWYALVQGLRAIAPVMPFLAEHLWRNLVAGACEQAPPSVFLAPWPQVNRRLKDEGLLSEVQEVRQVVELGRQARGAASLRLRQPVRRLVVQGAPLAERHANEISEELRVKEVEFADIEAIQVRVKPNFAVLGPKLGRTIGKVSDALADGRFERFDDGRIRVADLVLEPDEVIVQYSAPEGRSLAQDGRITVMLDTRLDQELESEGRVLDLIHNLNAMRKQAGFDVTDRIMVTLPEQDAPLLRFAGWIADEVLAVSIEAHGDESRIKRV